MAEIWVGDTGIQAAKREGRLQVSGNPVLVRTLPSWLRTSQLAHIRPHPEGLRA